MEAGLAGMVPGLPSLPASGLRWRSVPPLLPGFLRSTMSGSGSKAEFMPQEKPSFCEDEKKDWKKQTQGAIPQPLQRLRTAMGVSWRQK